MTPPGMEEAVEELGKILCFYQRGLLWDQADKRTKEAYVIAARQEMTNRLLPALLNEVREKLLSDEAIEVALLAEGAVFGSEVERGEITPDKSERMTKAGIEAAFDFSFPQNKGTEAASAGSDR